LERLEERYLRLLFGLDSKTPGYLIREEIKRNKLRERAGERAWSFEKRLEKGLGSELTRILENWKEMRERSREGRIGSAWEAERKEFFERREWDVREVERRREKGDIWGIVKER